MREDAEQIVARLTNDPAQQQEWLRENNLIYGGLIGAGAVLLQPFLTAPSLDVPATISVVAFAVAIPILAALLLLNHQESFRRRATRSLIVDGAKALAQVAAFVGVVAAFWHIAWFAGAAVLVSALVATGVHSAGFARLELDDA
jgi:hypothetical protein